MKDNNDSHRLFGCHVSASGGLERALMNGQELKVNCIQLHPAPPQRWNAKPYPPGIEERFLALRKEVAIEQVFFHGIYLINLANPDKQQFHLSKTSLLHHLELCARIGAQGVIFHVGNAKHVEDEEEAFRRAADGINWIMEHAPHSARLLLEVAAGSGSVIGDRVEELRAIYDLIEAKDRVGFALDSQHLWASGYDLAHTLDEIILNFEAVLHLEKVWAIHLNDSKVALASRKDRLENLGDGLIGTEALSRFVNHPKLRHLPFILETPGLKSMDTAQLEVEKLRAMLR